MSRWQIILLGLRKRNHFRGTAVATDARNEVMLRT